jgi:hypothetical protein
MRLNISKNLVTYAILLFYICTPMLDSAVCVDCAGHAPFQGETTLSHMQTSHTDVSYSTKDETQSDDATEQGHQSVCSICANVLIATDVSSVNPPVILAQCEVPRTLPLISELHYSIDKPPQNLLV